MKANTSTNVRFLVQAAMIAALYTALTLVAVMLNWAFGPVQFRFSEAMTVLPMFTSAAIPGLTIGCFLSNLWSSMGVMDMIFGTLATLLAAIATRAVRHVRVKGIPVLAPLPPVLFNALIVGLEITIVSPEGFLWPAFLANALSVGAGELAACYVLGLPLAILLDRLDAENRVFSLRSAR